MGLDNDLILVLGMLIGLLSLPAGLSAYAERRTPVFALVSAVIGGAMIYYAYTSEPGGYTWEQIPYVVTEIVARLIR